jgi:hypothetical protein
MSEQESSSSQEATRAAIPASASERQSARNARTLLDWQIALLPLMTVMLVGLTLFFFVASFVQLNNLHNSISDSPKVQLERTIALVNSETHRTSADILRAGELQILAALEGYALDRRYHQANVLLMSRVWIRYLGFVTGMILGLVGSSFILGKMRSDRNEATITAGPVSAAFQGTEPGLILALLGVALMITTIVTHHPIATEDAPTFMQVWMRRSLGDELRMSPPVLELDGLEFADEQSWATEPITNSLPSIDGLLEIEGDGSMINTNE